MSSFQDPETRCKTTYDPIERIWKGVRGTPVFGPDCSIGEAVIQALKKDPYQISQICNHNGKEYTNQDIANLSIRIAQRFRGFLVKQTENISIVAGNSDFVAPLVFGATLCGLTVSPVNPILDKDEIKAFYLKVEPTFVFTTGSVYPKIKQCLQELGLNARIYTVNNHISGVPEITELLSATGTEEKFRPEPLIQGENQIAVLIRSSGTTATPKIVCVTHASLLNTNRPKFNQDTKPKTRPIFLHSSTLFWISGWNRLINNCLLSTTLLIDENGFKSSTLPAIVKKYQVTFISSIPHLLIDILKIPNIDKSDFASLRHYYTGGSYVPYSLIEKARTIMTNTSFYSAYGSTEVCGTITTGPINSENHNGQLVPNLDVKIVDEQDRHLGIGEIGELCTRSIFPWPGYYKDPELTAAVYKNGWMYSGDLGYINKEGNLFMLERKKDVVQYLGKQIYPNELEKIIAEIPGVLEVCVCVLPSAEMGGLLAAAVCKADNCNISAEEICEYAAKKVEDHKKLRGGVYFTSFIPKTLTGKNLRQRAVNICEAQRISGV